jgi:hypothetical protein
MSELKPSIIKNVGQSAGFPEIKPGTYAARIQAIYHIGTQPNNFTGAKNPTRYEIVFVYEILDESVEINGEELPRVKSKTYTYSLNEKATLGKTIKELRGAAIQPDEAIDLTTLLDTPCIISFVEGKNKREDGTPYLEFGSITAPMKGMSLPPLRQPKVFFDFDSNYNPALLESMPKWIATKIQDSPEYKSKQPF